MQAEEAYIHLYKQHAGTLGKSCSDLLNSKRETAFDQFQLSGFPTNTNEEYLHCDLQEALSIDYGLNINRLKIPINPHDVFSCDVPNLSTKLFFVVNDQFYKNDKPIGLPEGVLCGSLNDLTSTHAHLLEPYYAKLSEKSSDGMVSFNTSFVQDGFVLYVPAGVVIEKPIQLIQVLHGEVDMMANRRLLIILEEGAKAQMLVCDHALSSMHFFSNLVTEIFVGKNASLEYYELEMDQLNTARVSNTMVSQAAASQLLMNGVTLQNGLSRNNIHVRFDGEGAEAHLSGMALGNHHQLIDHHIFVDHAVPHCSSRELYKYVLDDSARGVFCGRILVRKDAQKTSAYQSNKNLCSSREAKMFAKPQLEIYADDVKCSHGTATGQIDEKALFYMRSRGISESEARLLLKFAFTADVLDNIRLEPLRDRMRMLVEKRFRGELAKCAGCSAANCS
ncbi:MAG: Fe-S cluster assembly protein SufD [Bacteroidales bacterium]|nr:Fe-S cluster assembly protein SufD [Bacteroidales bacterium]